ncbi:Imidazoleglycerol-phosphate dehydratase [Ammonifex degensii KC4]|uniref:Imidazoleglycerol-phosphate dehydratase n=1 Tax=Ammonifex degensii (strain DSM 10501 / KC4) TaxID=429009 RepID=C9RB50_AMMDK|nr:imidazoleglycerol-phosphate dehydratase HisB [Ammonifex degensii]ACX51477.1 Imidazoleglycerol-phosphate dehydratase [Ammonifex degensii KC4]
MRRAEISRKTKETEVRVELCLDGQGRAEINTGIGFFNHMLEAFTRFSNFDLKVRARGDLEVDAHHTVEDVGIVLGKALEEALGNKEGIARFGHAILPMDEALVLAAVDVSGRRGFYWEGSFPTTQVGGLDVEVIPEFFRSLAFNARITLHLRILAAENTHHAAEALFKACGLALGQAVTLRPHGGGIPSTKGVL